MLNNSAIYFGFVEDVNDPLKVGRVRVRVAGIHTSNKDDIPTNHLPWYSCVMPVNFSGAIQPPTIGSQVIVTPLDESLQQFIVLGVVPGINETAPDTPDIDRNDSTPDIVTSKSNNRLIGIINEPNATSTYKTKYPYNKGFMTPGGHAFEFDDTPGSERIHFYHKSGSYIEIIDNGTIIMKSVNDSYHITSGVQNISSESINTLSNNMTITVDGEITLNAGTCNISSTTGIINGLRCQFTGSSKHTFG